MEPLRPHQEKSSPQRPSCDRPPVCTHIQQVFEKATITSCAQVARQLHDLWRNDQEDAREHALQTVLILFHESLQSNVVSHRVAVLDLLCELYDICPAILKALDEVDALTRIFTMPPSIANLFIDFASSALRSGINVSKQRPDDTVLSRRQSSFERTNGERGGVQRYPSHVSASDTMTDLYRVIHTSNKFVKMQQLSQHYQLGGDNSMERISHDAQVLERVLSRVCSNMWQQQDWTIDNLTISSPHRATKNDVPQYSSDFQQIDSSDYYSTGSSSSPSNSPSSAWSRFSWGQYYCGVDDDDDDDDNNNNDSSSPHRNNSNSSKRSFTSRLDGFVYSEHFWQQMWVHVVSLVAALNVQLDSAIARMHRRLDIKLMALQTKDESLNKLVCELESNLQSVDEMLATLDQVESDFAAGIDTVLGAQLTTKLDAASTGLMCKIAECAKSMKNHHIFHATGDFIEFHSAQVCNLCSSDEQRQLDDVISEQLVFEMMPLSADAENRIQDLLEDLDCIVAAQDFQPQHKRTPSSVDWEQFADELTGFVPKFGDFVRASIATSVRDHICVKNEYDYGTVSVSDTATTLAAATEKLSQRHAAVLYNLNKGWHHYFVSSLLYMSNKPSALAKAAVICGSLIAGSLVAIQGAGLQNSSRIVLVDISIFTTAVVIGALFVAVCVSVQWLAIGTIRCSRKQQMNTLVQQYNHALFGVIRVSARMHTQRLHSICFMAGPSVERKFSGVFVAHNRERMKRVVMHIQKCVVDVHVRIDRNHHSSDLLADLADKVQCVAEECPRTEC